MNFCMLFFHVLHQLLIYISLSPKGFLKNLLFYAFNKVINSALVQVGTKRFYYLTKVINFSDISLSKFYCRIFNLILCLPHIEYLV